MSFVMDYAFDHPSAPKVAPTKVEMLIAMAQGLLEDGYRLSGLGRQDFTPTDANCSAAKDRAIAGRQSTDPDAYEARLDKIFGHFREARIVFEENQIPWTQKTGLLYQEAKDAHVLMLSEQRFFSNPGTDKELKSRACIDASGAEYGAKPESSSKPASLASVIPRIPPVQPGIAYRVM